MSSCNRGGAATQQSTVESRHAVFLNPCAIFFPFHQNGGGFFRSTAASRKGRADIMIDQPPVVNRYIFIAVMNGLAGGKTDWGSEVQKERNKKWKIPKRKKEHDIECVLPSTGTKSVWADGGKTSRLSTRTSLGTKVSPPKWSKGPRL